MHNAWTKVIDNDYEGIRSFRMAFLVTFSKQKHKKNEKLEKETQNKEQEKYRKK